MNDFKKGLVIQGPIMSKGRTGETAHIIFSQVKEKDVVDFNCINNIVKIFNDYKLVFDYIVCVSWEDQDPLLILELKKLIPNDCLLLINVYS
jgi:hypothetical protein